MDEWDQLGMTPNGSAGSAAVAVDDAAPAGQYSNFDILNLLFEKQLGQAEIMQLLGELSRGGGDDMQRWMAILLQRVSSLMEVTNQTATLSLDEALPRLMEVVTRSLSADRASLFIVDKQSGELFSRVDTGDAGRVDEVRIGTDEGIAGEVYSTGKALIINEPEKDKRYDPQADKKHGYKTRNILCLPVRNKKSEIIGVAQVLNKKGGKPFTIDDQAMLDALTRQAAAALENAQLHEMVEQARRDEEKLLEISSAISQELQIDHLLSKIVKITTEFLDADRSTLFIYDKATNELWSRVAEGMPRFSIPANAGIAGACFTGGEKIHIPDAYEDPRFRREVDKASGYRTRNILCMPVINKAGRPIGVLQVLNKKGGPFTLHDERRLKAFSSQAAIALENAQLFEAVMNEKNYNESVLKSLSNAVVTLDTEDKVIKVNLAANKLLGLDPGKSNQKPVYNLLGKRNPWIMQSLEKVHASGDANQSVDVEVDIGGDEPVSVNMTIEPLIDVKENRIGTMLIAEDITGEKRVKATMARYMPKEIADKLLEGGESLLGGMAQEVSILFTDIRKFTTISEKLGARETVQMLNEYFTDMVDVVFNHHGILDKYIGDAIMAVFGAPFGTPLDANNAVTAANQMLIVLRALNERRIKDGREELSIGLGISTGEVVAGNIGSPKRMDYTVIGDPVNLAARLESATKQYGVKILLSEFTREGMTDDKRTRELDLIRVKGKNKPVAVFEGLDFHTEESFPNLERVVDLFETGIAHYRSQEWEFAISCFNECLSLHPGDEPSRLFLGRAEQYKIAPPGDDWDGVWTMSEK